MVPRGLLTMYWFCPSLVRLGRVCQTVKSPLLEVKKGLLGDPTFNHGNLQQLQLYNSGKGISHLVWSPEARFPCSI